MIDLGIGNLRIKKAGRGGIYALFKGEDLVTPLSNLEEHLAAMVEKLEQCLAEAEVEWQEFDYFNLIDEGVYWFVLQSPEYDSDVDNDGKPVGVPNGAIKTRVVMCHLTWVEVGNYNNPRYFPELLIVNQSEDRHVDDEEVITYWAEIKKPKFPLREGGGKGE